jgi:hypothetical protein
MSDKQLVAFVRGGLGNQMFIYAAARRMAIENNARLILATQSYENEFQGRRFLLNHFSIAGQISCRDAVGVYYSSVNHKIATKIDRYLQPLSTHFPHYAVERRKSLLGRTDRFDKRILGIRFRDYLFMDGLFLDESYFSDIADIIRSDFRLKSPLTNLSRRLASEISQADSVCLHFRRTELEKEELVRKHQSRSGLSGYRQGLGIDYYLQALDIIDQKVDNPRYFVFSDYPDWVRKNIRLPISATHVSHNTDPSRAYEDIYLMSQCRHHIISHSTYGWWGAWLANRPDHIVIAPRNTYGRPKPPYYPRSWITIDVQQKPA